MIHQVEIDYFPSHKPPFTSGIFQCQPCLKQPKGSQETSRGKAQDLQLGTIWFAISIVESCCKVPSCCTVVMKRWKTNRLLPISLRIHVCWQGMYENMPFVEAAQLRVISHWKSRKNGGASFQCDYIQHVKKKLTKLTIEIWWNIEPQTTQLSCQNHLNWSPFRRWPSSNPPSSKPHSCRHCGWFWQPQKVKDKEREKPLGRFALDIIDIYVYIYIYICIQYIYIYTIYIFNWKHGSIFLGWNLQINSNLFFNCLDFFETSPTGRRSQSHLKHKIQFQTNRWFRGQATGTWRLSHVLVGGLNPSEKY